MVYYQCVHCKKVFDASKIYYRVEESFENFIAIPTCNHCGEENFSTVVTDDEKFDKRLNPEIFGKDAWTDEEM